MAETAGVAAALNRSGSVNSADQIGTHATQIAAIEADPRYRGGDYYDQPAGEGPHVGMGIARRIAHLTYRSESELDLRFGRDPQDDEVPTAGGRFTKEHDRPDAGSSGLRRGPGRLRLQASARECGGRRDHDRDLDGRSLVLEGQFDDMLAGFDKGEGLLEALIAGEVGGVEAGEEAVDTA